MKKFVFSAAVCAISAAVAAPAQANEARAEVRGGVFFGSGSEDAAVGLAAGYDWDLSETLFVGLEASADKVLDGFYDDVSFGGGLRIGTSFGDAAKGYVIGGYNTQICDLCVDAWSAGAGLQYGITENAYLKAEYRRYFPGSGLNDYNSVLVGIGIAMD